MASTPQPDPQTSSRPTSTSGCLARPTPPLQSQSPEAPVPTQQQLAIHSQTANQAISIARPITADAFLNGGTTLIGAFLGATTAFLFQKYLVRRKERENNLAAAHFILFCLFQQTDRLLKINMDSILPYVSTPFPYIAIPALPKYVIELDTFKAESFSFMLKTKPSRLIAYELYLAQENYKIALKFVNDRSRIHIEKVQPLLAQAGITNGSNIPLIQLEKALGNFVLETIKNSTQNAITTVERSIDQLYSTYLKFREYAIIEFKSTDFTEFKLP